MKKRSIFKINENFKRYIFFCNNRTGEKNQKKEKKRHPGVDLVRLVGMYNIVLTHFLFYGNAFRKFSKYKEQLNLLHIFTDWHNNGFALISGIVGYKSNKYSNLLYLWLTVFFYSVGIHLYIKIFKREYTINYDFYIDFFPTIFRRYWYFTAYFGMYLFLPIINKGISLLTKSEIKINSCMYNRNIYFMERFNESKNRCF